MTRSSPSGKFFHIAFILACLVGLPISLDFAYKTLMIKGWGTVSFKCKPAPVQVTCQITRQFYPGYTTTEEIPKTQLTGVKTRFIGAKKTSKGIVLTTIDGREINFSDRANTIVTHQLESQMDVISAFIANSQAQTLSVETRPDSASAISTSFILIMFYYIAGTAFKAVVLDLKKI